MWSKEVISAAVGERLRQLRLERDMTQTDLARRMGIGYVQICSWECGSRPITLTGVYRLAYALGVQPQELLPPLMPPPSTGPAPFDVHCPDVEWFCLTGHCGYCGMTPNCCDCLGECGCAHLHGTP